MALPAPRFDALTAVLLVGGVALWVALGRPGKRHARTAYDAAGVAVERAGWDTLHVRPRFTRRTSLGSVRPARPASVRAFVFDARYDTLYAGPAGEAVPIPDRRLADREPLLIEACGTFRPGSSAAEAPRRICEQARVRASPKRVRAETAEVTFPEGEDFQRGRYDLRLRVERRVYGDTARWEALPDATPEGALLAQAQSRGGAGAVRIPVDSSGRGAFDLTRYRGYDDFSYHLRAAMRRPGPVVTRSEEGAKTPPPSATVRFEVQARPSGGGAWRRVRSVQKDVRRLTREERRQRVQGFAHEAARMIARQLLPEDEAAEDVRATVQRWRYDRIKERYTMKLRARWYEADDFDDRYTLEGTLTVEVGTRSARFEAERGTRRAVRRWQRIVEGEALSLGPLPEPPEEADLPPVEEERLRDVATRRPGGAQDREEGQHSPSNGDSRSYDDP